MSILILTSSFMSTASPLAGRMVPDFGQMYHIKGSYKTLSFILAMAVKIWTHVTLFKGVISLPYAEIKEPFEGWYDLQGKRSRIDYYQGEFSFTEMFSGPLCLSLC